MVTVGAKITRYVVLAGLLLGPLSAAFGVQYSSAFYSPRNPERELRSVTKYIILHTTEAPASSALQKLSDNGEANYCVDLDGHVYRIVDYRRIAFHCGRSMWNGQSNIDDFSIGIEVVGSYDHDITAAQYRSLRLLLAELKDRYHIPDERVLTHSMVAYGSPNKWFPHSQRGRKRCGMLFARADVRQRLHLEAKPAFDPDVRAGRLIVGDPYLERVLYGTPVEQERLGKQPSPAPPNIVSQNNSVWDIAHDAYSHYDTIYLFPDGTRRNGSQIRNWRTVPVGTKVIVRDANRNPSEGVQVIGMDGSSAQEIAGDEAWTRTTIYIFRDGHFVRGSDLKESLRDKLPPGTRMLVGFRSSGTVTPQRQASDICGTRWNSATTFFLLPGGQIKKGPEVREDDIPEGTFVFCRG